MCQDRFLKLVHLCIGITYYLVINTLKTQQNLAKYTKTNKSFDLQTREFDSIFRETYSLGAEFWLYFAASDRI